MKKISIILLSAVIMAIVIFGTRNTVPVQIANYYVAKKFVEMGWHRTFYWSIKYRLSKGDEIAQNILLGYFLKAVREGDLEETRYYLEQDPTLVNKEYEENMNGTIVNERAISVVLLVNNVPNLDMLKLLLEHHPNLNYGISYLENITPLMVAVMMFDADIVNLLIENGADINLSNKKHKTALSISFTLDKFDIFKMLLEKGANLKYGELKVENIIFDIAMSIKMEFPCELDNFIKQPINKECLSIIKNNNYKITYKNNIKYLQEIFLQIKKFSENDKEGFTLLATFLTASNQTKEMDILLEYDLCKVSDCDEILRVAEMNNNKEVIDIVNRQY
jgi:hypothetical protein